jgi:hypothetical protein
MMNFDEIRPFNNDELQGAIASLLADERFMRLVNYLFPEKQIKEQMLYVFSTIDNIDDFQSKIILPLLDNIKRTTTNGVTISTMDQFKRADNYLFISNHRDIILDPAFLNMLMAQNGFRTTEIAIGDNLLIYDWITTLVRINRSFVVKRNLGLREQLTASKELSAYIRHTLTRKGESVWIAQREGRSKDGNDVTQPAILKMLNMSNDGSLLEGFYELNIVPMAISYEIEPCGILKVEETLKRKYNPSFSKTPEDDIKSMSDGVTKPKGRVHFSFGNPVNYKLVELLKDKNTGETIQTISEYIDKRIYFNYKLWPNNYIAHDLLFNSNSHAAKYTKEEKEQFVTMMNNEVSTIAFDKAEACSQYLQLYANPVINYEKHFGE